ncbi:MAG TPA: methyltransferase domain-containing protein [Dehalococcoidia bacterium]|nr:methyltransferase domain-containing protein [Dehalococcoidia bacterium]
MKYGDEVLDVCCGTGAQVIEYGKQGILATGVDKEQSMLSVALKNKEKQKLTNVSFCQADATSLPFGANKFDYVSICFGLHDKEEDIRNKVVSEMKRVVKQEGSLVLADFNVPLPGNMWAMFARIIEYIAGGSHYRGFKDFINSGGLKNILNNHLLFKQKAGYFKGGILEIIQAKLYRE